MTRHKTKNVMMQIIDAIHKRRYANTQEGIKLDMKEDEATRRLQDELMTRIDEDTQIAQILDPILVEKQQELNNAKALTKKKEEEIELQNKTITALNEELVKHKASSTDTLLTKKVKEQAKKIDFLEQQNKTRHATNNNSKDPEQVLLKEQLSLLQERYDDLTNAYELLKKDYAAKTRQQSEES